MKVVNKIKRFPFIGKCLAAAIQWVCGLGGHEPDLSEWGYGGGEYADSWCRRCDKMIQVPKSSVWFKNKEARAQMGIVRKGVVNEP